MKNMSLPAFAILLCLAVPAQAQVANFSTSFGNALSNSQALANPAPAEGSYQAPKDTVASAPTPVANARPAPPATPVVSADQDLQNRTALAAQMADLTPPRDAVMMAINRIVATAPATEREDVRRKMVGAFDFDAFRQTTIKAMVQTFTAEELKKMIDYNSSPEAKSIAGKMSAYQALIQPAMTKELDIALMVARTGQPSDVTPQPEAKSQNK